MYVKLVFLLISLLSFQINASSISAFGDKNSYEPPIYEFKEPLSNKAFSSSFNLIDFNESEKNLCNHNYQLEYNTLVIAVEYNNQKFNFSESDISNRMFSIDNSVASYYKEATNQQTHIIPALDRNVNGILTLSLNKDHPGANLKSSDEKFRLFESDVKTSLDKIIQDDLFNFSKFDKNRNNRLETNELAIYFIFAGYEEAYSGNKYPNAVWGHRTYMNYYNSSAGIFINDFAASGEIFSNPNLNNSDKFLFEKGVVAHEMGHLLFCLPDLYDTDENRLYSGDIGNIDLMSSGSWNHEIGKTQGSSPSHFSTFSLSKMKLLNINHLDEIKHGDYSYNLSFNNMNSNIIFNKNDNERYFFEARGKIGNDSTLSDGLVITKITKNKDNDNFVLENINMKSPANQLENLNLDEKLFLSITAFTTDMIEVTTDEELIIIDPNKEELAVSSHKKVGSGSLSLLFIMFLFFLLLFNKSNTNKRRFK